MVKLTAVYNLPLGAPPQESREQGTTTREKGNTPAPGDHRRPLMGDEPVWKVGEVACLVALLPRENDDD
jgi:hypothetical protein